MSKGAQRLALLYRGPLDSCNYACAYCPFALRGTSRSKRANDDAALARFVDWAQREQRFRLELAFTPYGEALIWPSYQEAVVSLSQLPHVGHVSIQTNGSGSMAFLDRCDRQKVSLWISFHPTQVEEAPFVAKVSSLHERGVRTSVGIVAVDEATLVVAERLRDALPREVPMWVNARKPGGRYDAGERARWRAIDADFEVESRRHASRGRACSTGEDALSVEGDGTLRRCHFVDDVMGNLYADDVARLLAPRVCTRAACDCWIGYANLTHLGVRDHFEPGALYARRRLPLLLP